MRFSTGFDKAPGEGDAREKEGSRGRDADEAASEDEAGEKIGTLDTISVALAVGIPVPVKSHPSVPSSSV